MRKFRVTLPLDFGDGTIHQPGETVELDTDKAKLYSHALIALAEEKGETHADDTDRKSL
jgi:hypothetical protein